MRSRVEPDRDATAEADEALAREAARGSSGAFDALVRRHQRGVYALARRLVREHGDADDVAQVTFLRAWGAIGSYDPSRPFKPWLYRIATNTALNHLRTIRGRREEDLGEPEGLPARIASPGPDPDAEWRTGVALAAIDRAMSRLKPEERAVLHLRAEEEMGYRDMAVALGVRPGTVMSRLHRARAALRRELLREGMEP
jgi:RNA polymerase sigma-70 factor, ECF subfamily